MLWRRVFGAKRRKAIGSRHVAYLEAIRDKDRQREQLIDTVYNSQVYRSRRDATSVAKKPASAATPMASSTSSSDSSSSASACDDAPMATLTPMSGRLCPGSSIASLFGISVWPMVEAFAMAGSMVLFYSASKSLSVVFADGLRQVRQAAYALRQYKLSKTCPLKIGDLKQHRATIVSVMAKHGTMRAQPLATILSREYGLLVKWKTLQTYILREQLWRLLSEPADAVPDPQFLGFAYGAPDPHSRM